jgi:hypothetical protein
MFCWPASLYDLVNKANLVHSLFLVYLSISTCFGRLCAHHQEKQLCLCDIWYLLFCVDDCLVCRVGTRQNNKYQLSQKHSCFSWWWAHSRPKHVEIDKYSKNKYTKNKLCAKLALFTSSIFICGLTSHPLTQKLGMSRAWLMHQQCTNWNIEYKWDCLLPQISVPSVIFSCCNASH